MPRDELRSAKPLSIFHDPWNTPQTASHNLRLALGIALYLAATAVFAAGMTAWVASLS
jgi:hypothetical protein